MLTPRLTECLECADISALLSEIDCKLTDLAKAEYNNLVFSLNRPIQGIMISDLLTYKRILTNRLCNPDYACTYPLNKIASRVKLIHPIQCKPNCQEKDFRFYNPVSNVYPPTTIPPPPSSTTTTSSTTTVSGCQCYTITVPYIFPPDPVPVLFIPCGGGAPVYSALGTNKYCVSSIVSLGTGIATPITGSSCSTDTDCYECKCYNIVKNNTTAIDYIDCLGNSINQRAITTNTRLCARENSIQYPVVTDLTITDLGNCSNCPIYPPATGGPFSINWTTTVNNPCDPAPWTITNNNLTIRYDLVDSLNCGGTCDDIQKGTATATVQTGPTDLSFSFVITGSVELKNTGYEKLYVLIDGIQVSAYQSTGIGVDCAMTTPTAITYITQPFLFLAGSAHTIGLDFDSIDQNHHIGGFYQMDLTFT